MNGYIKKLNENNLKDTIDLIYEITVFNNNSLVIKNNEKSKKLFKTMFSEAFFEMEMFGYFVAEKLVGVIGIEGNDYITNLYIEKEYQNMNIGTLLLDYVKEHLKPKNDILEVCSLKTAVNFYLKNGFICYNEDSIDNTMMYYKRRNIYGKEKT